MTEFKYARANRGHELWTTRFRESQRNTAEVEILWRRFILTAEPENIKAVLATQFFDFGFCPLIPVSRRQRPDD